MVYPATHCIYKYKCSMTPAISVVNSDPGVCHIIGSVIHHTFILCNCRRQKTVISTGSCQINSQLSVDHIPKPRQKMVTGESLPVDCSSQNPLVLAFTCPCSLLTSSTSPHYAQFQQLFYIQPFRVWRKGGEVLEKVYGKLILSAESECLVGIWWLQLSTIHSFR